MRSRAISLTAAAVAAAVVALPTLPSSADAQTRTLSWTETSTVEVPGTLGMVLSALPGGMGTRASQRSLHIQGGVLIREEGGQTTLMDADALEFMTVDHEARTYMAFGIEESMRAARQSLGLVTEAMAEAGDIMEAAIAEDEEAMDEMRRAMEEAREALSFRITSESTGQTRRFGAAGTAAQHFIIAELGMDAPPEGVEDAEEGGTLVFVVELWQSRTLPTPDAFQEEWGRRLADNPQMRSLAAELAEAAEGFTEAGAAMFAMWDPRIAAGFGEIAEAVEAIEGTTVQSVVTVAVVPDGVELDRDELLAWQPESMGDRLRSEAAGAVRDAAAGAARSALRGLSGRLARGGDRAEPEPEAEEEAPPAVRPLLRVTTTKEDIVHGDTRDDVLGTLRQRMEGYRLITLDDLMPEARPQP